MTIRVLLPFIAATFLYSGSVVAEARPTKSSVSTTKPTVSQKKLVSTQKKPASTPKKLVSTQKKPASTPKKPTVAKVVQPKWQPFTPPNGLFTVLMPGTPKQETQIQKTYMGPINLQVFTAQPPSQEVAYVVTYNDFPYNYAQMNQPQDILNKAKDTALKTTQSNLVSQRNIRSSNGHPGKEIEYVNTGGKITISRMYIADGRLYQVTAITSKKQQKTLARTITGYLNSFQLVLKK